MQIGFLNVYARIMDARETRASLLANNIANADTPGYKAMDIPFEAALGASMLNPQSGPAAQALPAAAYRTSTQVALDGNDVSLDLERVESAQNGEAMIGVATFLHQSTADLVMALRPNPGGN